MTILSDVEIAERKRAMLAWLSSLPPNTQFEGERLNIVTVAVNNLIRDIADLFDTVADLAARYGQRIDDLLAANNELVERNRVLVAQIPADPYADEVSK